MLEFLNGPPQKLDATRPALANETYLLFAADPSFVQDNLLPLFSDEHSAGQVWGSFLFNPRVDDRMLAAGLLDGIIAEWNRLDNLGNRALQHRFFDLAASIVNFAGISTLESRRLLDQSVLASDGRHAAQFASAIGRRLSFPGAKGSGVWDLWLRDHVISRRDNLPRFAGPEELENWADAVPFLGERIPDAVDVMSLSEIGLGAKYDPPTFPAGALVAHGLELVGHLADRIRHSFSGGWAQSQSVRDLIDRARADLGDSVQPLEDAAREKGFIR